MRYKIKAIPTTYNGTLFRSRLEARWAAFFDAMGWRWEYEPIDLDGWIPDFVFPQSGTLVEVKPFFSEEEWQPIAERLSGPEHNVLLLGASVERDSDSLRVGFAVGPLSDQWGCPGMNAVEAAHFGGCCSGHTYGLAIYHGCWRCLVCGEGHKFDAGEPVAVAEWKWKRAGNTTQWRAA